MKKRVLHRTFMNPSMEIKNHRYKNKIYVNQKLTRNHINSIHSVQESRARVNYTATLNINITSAQVTSTLALLTTVTSALKSH